jgi:AraC-like DNA-binding protein
MVLATIKTGFHRHISLEIGKNFLNSKVMVSFDSSRPNFAPYGLTCEVWTPVPMQRADRHNEIELNLLKSGELRYLLGGQEVTINAGQLAVFWAAIPHQIIGTKKPGDYFVATIPLAWFLQCRFPEPFTQAILHGRVLLDTATHAAEQDAERFEQWVREVRDNNPARRRLVQLEMEARLLRFALSAAGREPCRPRRKVPARPAVAGFQRVEEMAAFIAQNYARKLTAGEIARAVGLHPNYAMAVFKKTFGLSLVDYVTQHRISHAQRLLATSDAKIVEVALESGFNSISRFNEAFKRACHGSPREYRRQHRVA